MIYVTLISDDELMAKMGISQDDLDRLRMANELPTSVMLDGEEFYVVEQCDTDLNPGKRVRRKAPTPRPAPTVTLMDFYADGGANA